MSEIKIDLFPGLEKKLIFKNNFLHYEEKHKGIKSEYIPIESSNFNSIKHEIVKENLFGFIKHHIGGDFDEMDDDEFERRLKKRKQESEEKALSGLEGKQEKEEKEEMEIIIEKEMEEDRIKKEIEEIEKMKELEEKYKEKKRQLNDYYISLKIQKNSIKELEKQSEEIDSLSKLTSEDMEKSFEISSKKLKIKELIQLLKEAIEKTKTDIKKIENEIKEKKEEKKHESKIVPYVKHEYELSVHSKTSPLFLIHEDLMRIIFSILHNETLVPKIYSAIKELFIVSKDLRGYYLNVFLDYLMFDLSKEFREINPRKIRHGFFLKNVPHYQPIPHSVKSLNFRDIEHHKYESEIIENLPYWIEELDLGDNFDSKINNFPRSLKHLKFGISFNQTLYNLPKNLKYLEVGKEYNQPFHYIPDSLETLVIRSSRFDKILPLSKTFIKDLKILSKHFTQPVDQLPQSLESLIISSYYFNQPLDKLPSKLKSLSLQFEYFNNFKQPLNKLPPELKNFFIRTQGDIIKLNLPKSLESLFLIFRRNFDLNIRQLKNLRVLCLSPFEKKKIDLEYIPETLKILNLVSRFNQKIDDIPDSIEILVLGPKFETLISRLPKNIKRLHVQKDYVYLDTLKVAFPNVEIITHENSYIEY